MIKNLIVILALSAAATATAKVKDLHCKETNTDLFLCMGARFDSPRYHLDAATELCFVSFYAGLGDGGVTSKEVSCTSLLKRSEIFEFLEENSSIHPSNLIDRE